MRKYTTIGGQAVMEGVMLRGRRKLAIAVRQPDGSIATVVRSNWRLSTSLPMMKLPFLRGVAALIEALVIGIDAILYSANASQPDDVQLGKAEAMLSMVLGLGMGVGLFILLPTFLVHFLDAYITNPFWLNLSEGILRLAIFLSYVIIIGLLPDMRRFFQYHGAEHKTIYAFEANDRLEAEPIQKYSCFHPRCGTAFMLLVMLVSTLTFSFLGWPNLLVRLLSRLALLPLVAGAAYELSRLAIHPVGSKFLGWLMVPAMLLQAATTRRPDDEQVDVAVAALTELLKAEPDLDIRTAELTA